jgi:hypothetical protein
MIYPTLSYYYYVFSNNHLAGNNVRISIHNQT